MQRLLRAAALLRQALRNFFADHGPDLSAAVAFYTLLALGPMLFLAGATFHRWLAPLGGAEGALDQAIALLPADAHALVQRLARDLNGRGALVLALPALAWISTSAVSALERAVNRAFGGPPGRPLWRSRLLSLACLGAAWLLLSLSTGAASLLPRLERLVVQLGAAPAAGRLAALASTLVAAGLSFGIFVLFLTVMPHVTVRLRAAAAGAAVSLVLWEVSRRVFGELLAHSTAFGLLSGTLAAVVAFLLWVQFSVAILLFGAETAALVNGSRPTA